MQCEEYTLFYYIWCVDVMKTDQFVKGYLGEEYSGICFRPVGLLYNEVLVLLIHMYIMIDYYDCVKC